VHLGDAPARESALHRVGWRNAGRVARSVTDFEYCCYLSDLAVDEKYQKRGIGKELIRLTKSKLGGHAKIILLSAPKAETYYPKIGFESHRSAWILPVQK
jgi:predicted N-acetyltransferase YhbS